MVRESWTDWLVNPGIGDRLIFDIVGNSDIV